MELEKNTADHRPPTTHFRKQGVLFTIVTIVILTLFSTSYSTYTLFQDHSSLNNRVATLNKFVISAEQDMPRQAYISTYRAILLFNKFIVEKGSYILDTQSELNELFFNASLYGVHQELMEEATFESLESFLQENVEKINANITLENPQISISQTDPWNIKVTFQVDLLVQDKSNLATWNKTSTTYAYISIENFDDPIYSKETSGRILNRITKTPYKNFVSGTNYSNLSSHFENSYYKESISAPNFIMRLEGDLSNSSNGVESLVNPQALSDAGIDTKYKSVVDYIYFSTSDPDKFEVPAVSNLILDNESNHLEAYNVSGIAVAA